MHLCARTSLTEMRGERRGRLTGTATAKQTLEHSHTLVVWHQLLDTHRHDVKLRHGSSHVGIALVGANHTVARGSHTEVATSHARTSLHKLVAQVLSSTTSQVSRVVIADFLGDTFLLKHLAYFLTLQVDGRHHDMAWLLVQELDDALTQVGLHHVDAMLLQVRIHLALLGEHRLRLHHLLHVVVFQNAQHNLIELLRILRPMHDDATALQVLGEHIKVIG